jgi:hypothetical protein
MIQKTYPVFDALKLDFQEVLKIIGVARSFLIAGVPTHNFFNNYLITNLTPTPTLCSLRKKISKTYGGPRTPGLMAMTVLKIIIICQTEMPRVTIFL